ncbi:hypothetical protein [Vibrio fluvialis]|uniref:hypothetical protein n=1 Tax=Vibrio fluvialis TaxID=676 RepID=UPI001EECD13F|nr:hypothetical protein [Vibrio fluvialis]MCG6380283.1 hypothetical protein [Vibrio fluvialis]
MKKYLLLAIAALLASTQANAREGWWRDADDYYQAWANSENSEYQAMIERAGLDSETPYVNFRLVATNESFCKDKNKDYKGNLLISVNDQRVTFKMTCYQNKYLNMIPVQASSNKYILNELNSYQNKILTFVIATKEHPDWVFTIPTKNFGEYYSSLSKSLKKAI